MRLSRVVAYALTAAAVFGGWGQPARAETGATVVKSYWYRTDHAATDVAYINAVFRLGVEQSGGHVSLTSPTAVWFSVSESAVVVLVADELDGGVRFLAVGACAEDPTVAGVLDDVLEAFLQIVKSRDTEGEK